MRPFAPQMLSAQRDHPLRELSRLFNGCFIDIVAGLVLDDVPNFAEAIHSRERLPQVRVGSQAARDVERYVVMTLAAARAIAGIPHHCECRDSCRVIGAKKPVLQAGTGIQRISIGRDRLCPEPQHLLVRRRTGFDAARLQVVLNRVIHVTSPCRKQVFRADQPRFGSREYVIEKATSLLQSFREPGGSVTAEIDLPIQE